MSYHLNLDSDGENEKEFNLSHSSLTFHSCSYKNIKEKDALRSGGTNFRHFTFFFPLYMSFVVFLFMFKDTVLNNILRKRLQNLSAKPGSVPLELLKI